MLTRYPLGLDLAGNRVGATCRQCTLHAWHLNRHTTHTHTRRERALTSHIQRGGDPTHDTGRSREYCAETRERERESECASRHVFTRHHTAHTAHSHETREREGTEDERRERDSSESLVYVCTLCVARDTPHARPERETRERHRVIYIDYSTHIRHRESPRVYSRVPGVSGREGRAVLGRQLFMSFSSVEKLSLATGATRTRLYRLGCSTSPTTRGTSGQLPAAHSGRDTLGRRAQTGRTSPAGRPPPTSSAPHAWEVRLDAAPQEKRPIA